MLTCESASRGSSRLDGESKLCEHLDGAGLPALEITGGKALARGELISHAQDCFRRVTAFVPDQIISRGRSESMRGEEPLRPQSVVLLYRAQHVSMGHLVPRNRTRHLALPESFMWR